MRLYHTRIHYVYSGAITEDQSRQDIDIQSGFTQCSHELHEQLPIVQ